MKQLNRLFNEGHPAPNHMQNEGPGEGEVAAMSEISREELDAKLDGTIAKLSARLASFESAVKDMLAAMRVDMVTMRAELRADLADMRAEQRADSADIRAEQRADSAAIRAEQRADSADIRSELGAMRADVSYLKNLKTNIWGAAGVTTGLLVAMLTYGVAHFDSGRATSELFQEVRQQTRETRLLLEEMKRQGAAAASAPAQQTSP